MNDAAALVAALAAGPRELAVLASLAGRVERQLLRALRLELAPHLSAADEADLWFSPVVESAGETGVLFVPETLPVLHRRLVEDPSRRLDPAWNLIFRLRTGLSFAERARISHSTWLLVQEELTYWGVRGGARKAEDVERIATLFAWVENSFAVERVARDASAWIKSARLRLPAEVWRLPGADGLMAAAQGSAAARSLFVRRVAEGVELSEQKLDAAHLVTTSAPVGPLRVDIVPRGEAAAQPRAVLVDGAVAFVATAAHSVDLVLADGQAFALDILQREPDVGETARRARLVLISRGGTQVTGVLLSPRYVLTCAHSTGAWRGDDDISVEVLSGSDGGAASFPRVVVAKRVAQSPFAWLPALPAPFERAADDLALLRLGASIEDLDPVDVPVVDPTQPVIGLGVTIHGGTPSSGPTWDRQVWTMTGSVVGVTNRGYTIESPSITGLRPGSSGSPVWLASGGLLGVVVGVTPDSLALVAPARSLESIVSGIPHRVVVAGSGKSQLPDNVWRLAAALGPALARAGHVLVCGGWPGVDYVVAQIFAAAIGDDAALASRFIQLVEADKSPDFKSSVAPTSIDPAFWAEQMAARADAVVALGGLGGTLALCRVALARGLPVLPVPGTAGDAETLYGELQSSPGRQLFPDRRALRIVEGQTATPEAAQAITNRIMELLGDCFDDDRLRLYRDSAAAVYRLVAESGGLSAGSPEIAVFLDELVEAAGGFPPPGGSADPLVGLRAILPHAARWLIRDLLRLDRIEPSSAVQKAQAALLDTLLADADASEQLAQMLAAQATGTEERNRMQHAWSRLATSDGDVDRLFARVAALDRQRGALAELRELANDFLRPVDMETFNARYGELVRAMRRHLPLLDEGVAAELMTSVDAADRVLGYVRFLEAPAVAFLPVLVASLRLERAEAFTFFETRPLWLLLECLQETLEEESLARLLAPDIDAPLSDLLIDLKASTDVDPGRECTLLLEELLPRLARSRTTERLASYSRYLGMRQGRRSYAWCVFVDAPRSRLDGILEVEYSLHPGFPEPMRRIADASHCFALQSNGWREFTLHVRIFYKSGVVATKRCPLKLETDAWPLGPVFSEPRGEPATLVYAALRDRRWDWRSEAALIRQTGIDPQQVRAVLADLARGGFVREAYLRSKEGEVLWGATAKVGVLPQPVD